MNEPRRLRRTIAACLALLVTTASCISPTDRDADSASWLAALLAVALDEDCD